MTAGFLVATLLDRLPIELGEAMHESCDTSRVTTEELLDVTVSEVSPGTILCVVVGEVDVLTGPTLREKLNTINDVPSHLVINLSAVRFLASIGLNILVEILAAQEAASRHLALVVEDNHAVSHVLETTGLDQVFDLYADIATAVRACPTPTDAHHQQ
ncbi:MAG: STAS domain-containing protein [Pseudonocardiaceae bacterium]